MGVGYDFGDVLPFFDQGFKELDRRVQAVGDEAVEYAKRHGNYRDSVGKPSGYKHLRDSSSASVIDHGLALYNDREYASCVEARGYEVLTGAALFAHSKLKSEIG